MVIALGVRPPAEGLAGAGYRRILQGQTLHLHTISNAAVALRAWIRVIYDDGTGQLLTVPETARSASRVAEDLASTDVVTQNGWVVNAEVEMVTEDIKRGQTYVRLAVEPFGAALLADYCFSEFGHVSLGTFVPPGPAGGAGHFNTVVVKVSSAPVSTAYVLPLSNMFRKILGFAWWYLTSSDVATRTLIVRLQRWIGTAPAGMGTFDDVIWQSSSMVLTADEDGTSFADEKRSGVNDNATLAIDDAASAPTPFPLWVTEDMASDMQFWFEESSGHANDLDTIYVLSEEWVVL